MTPIEHSLISSKDAKDGKEDNNLNAPLGLDLKLEPLVLRATSG